MFIMVHGWRIMHSNLRSEILLSGVQPSGSISLGQYLGVMKDWLAYQASYQCFFMVADLHAITTLPKPSDLYQRRYDTLAFYLAMGLDPSQSHIFFQSHVQEHASLSWLMNQYAAMGQLSRMTQFKDKSLKQEKGIPVGLFAYPVLMAADIALYGANYVPVGEDQKQHLELARDIIDRMNTQLGTKLVKPKPLIPGLGGRIKALQDPDKKMSKSDDNQNNAIFMDDSEKVIRKKIMRAVTDSETIFAYDPESRPGLANLLDIYRCVTGEALDIIIDRYQGQGYGVFKSALADKVVAEVIPIQTRWLDLRQDQKRLDGVLANGSDVIAKRAKETLSHVQQVMGIGDVSPG